MFFSYIFHANIVRVLILSVSYSLLFNLATCRSSFLQHYQLGRGVDLSVAPNAQFVVISVEASISHRFDHCVTSRRSRTSVQKGDLPGLNHDRYVCGSSSPSRCMQLKFPKSMSSVLAVAVWKPFKVKLELLKVQQLERIRWTVWNILYLPRYCDFNFLVQFLPFRSVGSIVVLGLACLLCFVGLLRDNFPECFIFNIFFHLTCYRHWMVVILSIANSYFVDISAAFQWTDFSLLFGFVLQREYSLLALEGFTLICHPLVSLFSQSCRYGYGISYSQGNNFFPL